MRANSLTSAGDITGVDALTLTVNQTLHNQTNGKLLSAGVLTLKADSATNDGQLQGNATTITAGQLTNGGHLQGETLTLTASGDADSLRWREQPFRWWCSDEPECTECQYCDPE